MTLRPVDQAVSDLQSVPDPYVRLRAAEELDAALVTARTAVARIKQDTIAELRTPATGYGTIAQRLGISKARVQQIANTPRPPVMAAVAFRDQSGTWHGDPSLLSGPLYEAATSGPFSPADKYNPLADQVLTVTFGEVTEDTEVSMYTMQVKEGPNGRLLNLRMTRQVQDALFGPPITGTPEHREWEAARERRRLEIDGT